MNERYTPTYLQRRMPDGYDADGRYVGVRVQLAPFEEPRIADHKVVRIKSGFVGQIIFRDEIVKEKQEFDTEAEAREWAVEEIDNALRSLFA